MMLTKMTTTKQNTKNWREKKKEMEIVLTPNVPKITLSSVYKSNVPLWMQDLAYFKIDFKLEQWQPKEQQIVMQ